MFRLKEGEEVIFRSRENLRQTTPSILVLERADINFGVYP